MWGGKGTGGVRVLWQMSNDILKTGRRYPGRSSSATSTDSKSAFPKPRAVVTLRFAAEDILEVHHRDGNRNNNRFTNLVLPHGHCHDQAYGKRCL